MHLQGLTLRRALAAAALACFAAALWLAPLGRAVEGPDEKVAPALAVAPIATAGSAPKFDAPKAYYLALGDSVAYGYQLPRFLAGLPPSGYDSGYVDVFAARLGLVRPGITAVNYGCPGETSTSFIEGGCLWKAAGFALHDNFAGSQLDGALAFLREHPGQVSPITITLWGGDVRELVQSCGGDFACVQSQAPAAIGKLSSNLALILERLRATAPSAEIIVTGVWNSFVGAFPETDPLFLAADESIEAAVTESRTRFAEMFAVFNPQGDVAAETASVCALTQLCSFGDSHPSDLGYSTIADLVFDASGYSRLIPGGDPVSSGADTFELRPGTARSFDHVAIGDPSIRQYVRPVVVDLNPSGECPAVVSGELLDREGINGIIGYDSVAFLDPWLAK